MGMVLKCKYRVKKGCFENKRGKKTRSNIALKCNYCDGGQTDTQIGYNGACSKKTIINNIKYEKRQCCSSSESMCAKYMNKEITRRELDDLCKEGGYVCYESQMLRDWTAGAGGVLKGDSCGRPLKFKNAECNKLCVLTTRDFQRGEPERYIFAVFLVDQAFEGDEEEAGYVACNSKYRIKLSPTEARNFLFWNYHANGNMSETPKWGTGLHRYFQDKQAAQILKDIAEVKSGTVDEQLAIDFFTHFCKINGVDVSSIGAPQGALQIQ